MKTKRCSICKKVKNSVEFSSHPNTKDRLNSKCRACQKTYHDKWYIKNRKDRLEYNKEYYSTPKGKYSLHISDSKQRGIRTTLTEDELRVIHSNPCIYCGKLEPAGRGRTIDRLDNNNGYSRENTVSSCRRCNSAKGNKTLKELKALKNKTKRRLQIIGVLEQLQKEGKVV